MENKKTTELLDLLWQLENEPEEKQDWDKYSEAYEELLKRTPYNKILGESEYANESTQQEQIEQLIGDVKLLKRHKHDDKTGDVLVRI